jgi:ParB-like chromosome segregation protein Spo0J
MNDEIYRPKLLKTKLTLTLAEQLTGVAYHTMYSANEANRLGLIRTLCAENERIEVLLIDLVDYMITQAPENQRWHAVPLPIEKVLPKPGMQPRVNPHDADLIHDIAASLKRGKAVDPIWVFQSQDYYFPVDGHRRLAAHIKAGRDDISAVVIELPEVYARPLSVAANSRQGKNLTVTDVRAIVIEQLRDSPSDVEKLLRREINANAYAQEIGVSPATLSRALQSLNENKGELPAVTDVFHATKRYLESISKLANRGPEDELTACLIIHSAIQKSLTGVNPQVLTKHKITIRNRDSEIGRIAPSFLLALFDRRGGDRRSRN